MLRRATIAATVLALLAASEYGCNFNPQPEPPAATASGDEERNNATDTGVSSPGGQGVDGDDGGSGGSLEVGMGGMGGVGGTGGEGGEEQW